MGAGGCGSEPLASAERSWTVPLDIAALAEVEREVHGFLAGVPVDGHAANVAQLVVEEVVLNLIRHAAAPVDETASVRVVVEPGSVTVRIEDGRPPFDPQDAPPLDVHAPLEARRVGGMGVHLVRELTDHVTYERVGDRNRLTAMVRRA